MNISHDDLIRLQHQIAADRKRLDEKEKALAIVLQMMQEQQQHSTAHHDIKPENILLTPERQQEFQQMNFAEAARAAVDHFDGEFSSADVDNFLLLHAVSARPKKPRSMIAMVLKELESKKAITLVKKGAGIHPNRYRKNVKAKANGHAL